MNKNYYHLISLACLLFLSAMLLAACEPTVSPTSQSDGGSLTHSETETTTVDETKSDETGLEWPASEMGDLPVPDARINAVTRDTESRSCTVLLSELNSEQAERYIEYIELAGYELIEMQRDAEGFLYNAENEQAQISFIYYAETSEGMLVYSIMRQESSSEDDPDVTSPVLHWPDNDWSDLPVLDNTIDEIIVYDDWDRVIYFSQVNRSEAENYIEKLRPLFAVDAVEQYGDGSIFYLASNEAGDYLEFYWSDDQTASIELIRWSLEMTDDE